MTPSDAEVLDQAGGLRQLMGDRVLYRQILRSFRQRYANAAVQAGAALAGGDRDGAIRIVHTLQGAAGMLGAQQLQRVAARLEAAACTLPLAPLEQALQLLLRSIDALLEDAAGAAVPGSAAAVTPAPPMLVRHLARLLEDGDGAAIDVLEQSAAALAASLGTAVFEEVMAAAQQFDFDAALARLRRGPAP